MVSDLTHIRRFARSDAAHADANTTPDMPKQYWGSTGKKEMIVAQDLHIERLEDCLRNVLARMDDAVTVADNKRLSQWFYHDSQAINEARELLEEREAA